MLTILLFLLLLGISITIHELGHFLAARYFKIKVEEFAIGFGPIIYSWTGKETLFSLRAIPLGGFNKIKGEGERINSKDSFSERPFRERFIVLVAGATMNIILGILTFYVFLFFSGFQWQIPFSGLNPPLGRLEPSHVEHVIIAEASPESSLTINEITLPIKVISLNNIKIDQTSTLQKIVNSSLPKTELTLVYQDINNDGTFSDLQNTKVLINNKNKIGISLYDMQTSIVHYNDSFINKVFSGVSHSYNILYITGDIFTKLLKTSVVEKDLSPLGDSVNGLVGLYVAVDVVKKSDGLLGIIGLLGLLNLNLGIFNLLPLPLLDGGHITIGLLEKLRRKRFSEKTLNIVNIIGLVFILLLTVIITIKDIKQFEVFKRFANWFKNIV